MSIEDVRRFFKKTGFENRIIEFNESSATVELASAAIGCDPERIAKTMAFYSADSCILIVTSGDCRIDNRKFKERFGIKPKLLSLPDVERMTGHKAGGVCPFAVNDKARIFLDNSLKRFESVYPACGSENSVIRLSLSELEVLSGCEAWVDVAKTISQ